jgi:acid stress chaperone HdeA
MSRAIRTTVVLVLAASAALAADGSKVDPTKMTCEEFLALDKATQPVLIAWLKGYTGAGGPTEEVVSIPAEGEVAYVVARCTTTPATLFSEKIDARMPPGGNNVGDPTKMTCEKFLAVRDELQPAVAYWLDGYTVGGGTGAKAESAEAGAKAGVAAVPLGHDMAVVVAECQGAPKESLWEKIKKEFRRS